MFNFFNKPPEIKDPELDVVKSNDDPTVWVDEKEDTQSKQYKINPDGTVEPHEQGKPSEEWREQK